MTRFEHIRKSLLQGVTQDELAKALGKTQANISNYEKGQTVPPAVAEKLIEFASSKGVKLTYNDIYPKELALDQSISRTVGAINP
jgi:putative transcriptional regulator